MDTKETNLKEIDLKELVSSMLKWWWILVAIPLLAITAAVYINYKVLIPVYQADTTILITGLSSVNSNVNTIANGNSDDTSLRYEDIVVGQTLVSEYSEIIKSKRVTSMVIKELKDPSLTESWLSGMISISSVKETRIIDISVTNQDPAKAAKIADAVAEAFTQEIVALYKVENINIIDKAEVPKIPAAPSKKKNIAIAGLVAFMFAAGLVFVIEFLDNTIKTSEDVERYLGLNVIGSIPVNTVHKGKKK
jgi:capsular polysaccharide biosynthesis protein